MGHSPVLKTWGTVISKVCTTCKKEKPLSTFNRRKKNTLGFDFSCKSCKKQYRIENLCKIQAAHRKWLKSNPEKSYQIGLEWGRNNKDKIRDNRLKKKYGIDSKKYQEILDSQGGSCAICRAPQSQYTIRFAVDHSHVSNRVRGLLCMICNRMVCGSIDKRAKSKNVNMSEMEYVERLYQYYKRAEIES